MRQLLNRIEKLKKSNISKTIDTRMAEFKKLGKTGEDEIFKECCFCILTANFNAERGIKIQQEIGSGFYSLPEKKLASRLAELGYRYPNTRAQYIVSARPHKQALFDAVRTRSGEELRKFVITHIKGLGKKEASHFLRNIGFEDYAIIDFHIVDLLVEEGLVEQPKSKTLTPKRYDEIEAVLRKIGKRAGLNLAELDLYLWYLETGKVLK